MNKENDIKLSIVVPVYNAERYLAACLESLKAQGDLPIEVILVDDGSTDGSAAIAEAYVRDDARFHLLRRALAAAGEWRGFRRPQHGVGLRERGIRRFRR